MLERLRYYGVFDYIVFRVDRGTVYLAGYTFEGRLQMRELAARRASGVVEVANKIQVLSMAPNNDRSAGRCVIGSTPMTSRRGTRLAVYRVLQEPRTTGISRA